ncbi:MAG: hypothetical protein HWN65_18825 [Candidatus Helarchaeota archaeon]|nr:hypothetical protein [Candidatus Helarchaeota archaeon]
MSKKNAKKEATEKKAEKKEAPKEETKKPEAGKPAKKPSVTIVEDKSKLKGAEPSKLKMPPKEEKKPEEAKPPKKVLEAEEEPDKMYLDTLPVGTVDGIGPKITDKLDNVGIKSLDHLVRANPAAIQKLTKIPLHRLMEYQKKAEKILEIEVDPDVIDMLAAKNYTIEKAIEEDPKVLMEITKREKDEVMDFMKEIIPITMFLDAATCRTTSIGILHRWKKKREKVKREVGKTLDTLSVEAIDGVGTKITSKLGDVGIVTIANLARAYPATLEKDLKMPIHKIMEYRKKAQMILRLELDGKLIDTLADRDYSIEAAIEEKPETIMRMSGRDKDRVLEFLDNIIQITMFLDAAVCRENSVSILHKSEKGAWKPELELDEMRYLGKEQILAKIYSSELDYTILRLLRERARNKTEITRILEDRMMQTTLREVNDAIDLLVQTEVVQLEWFEGNFDVHLFLISDFGLFRLPPWKIMKEAEKNLPSPVVAEKYLEAVQEFFANYTPGREDNLFVAKQLQDPDIFVTLTLLRERTYPLKKFPKGMGDGVDMQSIIRKMVEAGIVKIIQDETKEEWVLLLTDIRAPQFYPEYMIENIRKDATEKKIKPELAVKHLDLLEMHYDTFFEIYSTFFKFD